VFETQIPGYFQPRKSAKQRFYQFPPPYLIYLTSFPSFFGVTHVIFLRDAGHTPIHARFQISIKTVQTRVNQLYWEDCPIAPAALGREVGLLGALPQAIDTFGN
jgi:hypothetical protein